MLVAAKKRKQGLALLTEAIRRSEEGSFHRFVALYNRAVTREEMDDLEGALDDPDQETLPVDLPAHLLEAVGVALVEADGGDGVGGRPGIARGQEHRDDATQDAQQRLSPVRDLNSKQGCHRSMSPMMK